MDFRSEEEIIDMDGSERKKYLEDVEKFIIAYNKVSGVKKMIRMFKRKFDNRFVKRSRVFKK